MRGSVKWFNDKLGYGFISSKSIDKDIYIHFSEIKTNGYKSLRENDIVEFDYNEKENKATNLKILKKARYLDNVTNSKKCS